MPSDAAGGDRAEACVEPGDRPAVGEQQRRRRARRSSCPRVAMNGGSRPERDRAGRSASPQRRTTASAGDGRRPAPASPPAARSPGRRPTAPASEPTERSIPPEMITKVMPTATIALMARLLHHVEQVRDGQEVRSQERQQHDAATLEADQRCPAGAAGRTPSHDGARCPRAPSPRPARAAARAARCVLRVAARGRRARPRSRRGA